MILYDVIFFPFLIDFLFLNDEKKYFIVIKD